ncbi:MAG: hypothetical protein MUF00_07530 [Gemmatimonadaceae bacterium]|jgi:protocatechuate 3,4-dioxygenase beta subunit|nr:hypothetical protein [Gemmatimonadaceae bacterium]
MIARRCTVCAGVAALAIPWRLARGQASPDDAACQPPAPSARITASVVHLAPAQEPGERFELRLRFRTASGAPLRALLVYVYHANGSGEYVPARAATGCLRFHGALHGWATPDAGGRVTVHTIRPGGYPRSSEPSHVHVVVQFPGHRGIYINDTMFDDDPRLTPAIRAAQQAPGGSGVVHPVKVGGVWRAERDVVLQQPTR